VSGQKSVVAVDNVRTVEIQRAIHPLIKYHFLAAFLCQTKSIFSVVRVDDSAFAHNAPSYDGKDELN
jgi:hypothetical protein